MWGFSFGQDEKETEETEEIEEEVEGITEEE